MTCAGGTSARIGTAPAIGLVKAELFGGDLVMVRVAEVARIDVLITATLRERLDVVDYIGRASDALI